MASASASSHVVISELQTGNSASASQEFIELYNPTSQPLALDKWQIQYRPAGTTCNWTTKTGGGLTSDIAGDGFYLIAPTAYLPNADADYSSGMSAGSGSVRLVDSIGNVIDLLGWGSAAEFEQAAAAAPAAGGSLERLPGLTNPSGGNGIDSDNNARDFGLRGIAEPQSSASAPEIPGEVLSQPTPIGSTTSQTPPGENTSSDTSAAVEINELLIDPVAPQTAAKTSAKKVTTKKAAATKVAKIKTPKSVKATGAAAVLADTAKAGLTGRWLIIGLGALTLGYAIYEFRYDLQSYYILGRRKYGAWREARTTARGR